MVKTKIREALDEPLIACRGFIRTHNYLGMARYARRKDDSVLMVSAAGTWMHNVDWKITAEGTTFQSLNAYLAQLK